jgi:hypothetical protein
LQKENEKVTTRVIAEINNIHEERIYLDCGENIRLLQDLGSIQSAAALTPSSQGEDEGRCWLGLQTASLLHILNSFRAVSRYRCCL